MALLQARFLIIRRDYPAVPVNRALCTSQHMQSVCGTWNYYQCDQISIAGGAGCSLELSKGLEYTPRALNGRVRRKR